MLPNIVLFSEQNTPQNRKSRRRPTLHTARSDLAEKYNKLLEKQMEVAELQTKKLQKELAIMEEESNLKRKLLELQIELENEKLKRFRN